MDGSRLKPEYTCCRTSEADATLDFTVAIECSVWIKERVHELVVEVDTYAYHLSTSAHVCVSFLL